jgi:hypothetical protein
MKIKVKDRSDLVRDSQTMAILNVDKNVLNKDLLYKQKMRREKQVDEAINKLENDVNEIKGNLNKILQILETRGP